MRAAGDRRFDTSPSTSEQVHSGNQQGKAHEVHGADWRAIGKPGDDCRENESASINGIENGEDAAAFKCRHEKYHHCDVANYPAKKPRIENVTCDSVTGLFRARFVIELPERAEKSRDNEKENSERRGSHRRERE
jgi:hypothetical protein